MSDKKKILFIINPISGTRKKEKLPALAKQILNPDLYDLDFYYTKSRGDGGRMAQEARYRNIDAVIAVGGDGTINEIASELVNSETALGVIPFGSGNGFARHLQIPLETEKALELINRHPLTKMDSCYINEIPFFNVSGLGFDAYVSYLFSLLPGRGLISYIKATARAFFNFKPFTVEISSKDGSYNGKAFLLSVANTCQFGNNCYINPAGDVTDGLLEIVVFKPFPLWKAPVLVYKLFNKSIHVSKYVQSWSTAEASINVHEDHKMKMHLDGDAMSAPERLNIRLTPASLKVIAGV